MFSTGDKVHSRDERDNPGDVFTVTETEVDTTSGPASKIRGADGQEVYRLDVNLRRAAPPTAAYGILNDTEPPQRLATFEAIDEEDALAQYAVSKGYGDPRKIVPSEDEPGYFFEHRGTLWMVFENTELRAQRDETPFVRRENLEQLTDSELAELIEDGGPAAVVEAAREIAAERKGAQA